jgi:1-acyl-sn-glycerol-3-phosphate acyltransferase
MYWIARVFSRRVVTGVEHLSEVGGAVVVCNHLSPLDAIFLGLAVNESGRTIRFVGAAEAFDNPLFGWALKRIHQIPVQRGKRDVKALEGPARIVRGGGLVGIYPEGRIGLGPELQSARRGAARIALNSTKTFVPAGAWGMNVRWDRHPRWRLPLRPIVAVAFGPPITVEGDPHSGEDLSAATDRLMEAIAKQVVVARSMAPLP